MGKYATDVVGKTTLRRNSDKGQADPVRDLSLRQDVTHEGQIGPKENADTNVMCWNPWWLSWWEWQGYWGPHRPGPVIVL